jgi:hypothetical protein
MSDDKRTFEKDSFGTWETHPSYGVVMLSRASGSPTLFGSKLRNHGQFIILQLCNAKVRREDGDETYFGTDRVAEVWLSAAQFASLLTTMNTAPGVPCTLRSVGGVARPLPPTDIKSREYPGELQEEAARPREQPE